MQKEWRVAVAMLFGLALVPGGAAFAQGGGPPAGGPGAGSTTVITKAVANFTNPAAPVISIHGEHFGPDPVVTLGDDFGLLTTLTVTLATDMLIDAELPPAIVPGSYMLIVEAGNGATSTGILDITIGAVGPQGPIGLDGPEGPEGPEGPQGIEGPQGPMGLPGTSVWGLNGGDTFYSAGKVGIGTTNPDAPLEVNGSIAVPGGSSVAIFRADSPQLTFGNDFGQLEITNADQTPNNYAYLDFSDNPTPGVASTAIGTKFVNHGANFGDLFFWTRGSSGGRERLYITSDGNVGIGTTNPISNLHVMGGAVVEKVGLDGNPAISIRNEAVNSNPAISVFNDTTGWYLQTVGIRGDAFEITRAFGTEFHLATSGYLGLGTTTPSDRLHVVGNILATGSITPGSSREFKDDIALLTESAALDAFAALEPITFTYKADESEDLQLGFIAEDVPELVSIPSRKGIAPMDLVALLTKVVQTQQERITDLEERLRRLEESSR